MKIWAGEKFINKKYIEDYIYIIEKNIRKNIRIYNWIIYLVAKNI